MSRRRRAASFFAVVVLLGVIPVAAAQEGGLSSIKSLDLKEWLTYIASDELEGRAVYTTGIGLAAAYIEGHLRVWGAKAAGDSGSYLQTVRVLGVKEAASHSTITVQVGGQTQTFADGGNITFPKNAGGKRQFTIDHVEFAGYGLNAPAAHQEDYRGRDVNGAAVIWLGAKGPKGFDPAMYRRLLAGRNRYATDQLQAAASIGPEVTFGGRGGQGAGAAGAGGAGAGRAGGPLPTPDFTTVQRLDQPIPPNVTATDAFFEFVFSEAPTPCASARRT